VNAAIKQENRPAKRERAVTNSTPMPPLKTSKGANGQIVYHLDYDEEDDAPPQKKGQQKESLWAGEDVEVVTI
jgi:hypothetical protein